MLAPIIIFVYARPEHTKKTIEALANNYLAKESEVFIFSDGPKNKESEVKVNMVRNYIDSIKEKDYFKSVTIYKSSVNKGLANSIISGVTQIINKYNKVIVLEDDLITTQNFLVYMNKALDYYEKSEKIWSISGFTYPIENPKNYSYDTYLFYRCSSWGWATWKDRWDKTDWDVKDFSNFKDNKLLQNKFNRGGYDLSNMLKAQMEGKIDSWAIRWCYSESKYDMLTVYPVKSKIKNIGFDGTGVHCGVNEKYDRMEIDFSDTKRSFIFSDEINKIIVKKARDSYMSKSKYIKSNIKKFIKKIIFYDILIKRG
ncbi:sugar transferase [Marinitoga sp. 1135]|uniref:glycosyltransferase n=1 Tax=Marinitoga sp. 1135 TaxID=1643333 RepID=UPI001586C609|nr:glycosyltransferase [Marinitoga sp. 1135]NUU95815.1 sugar transferase [Marinitoga sp. 1135]